MVIREWPPNNINNYYWIDKICLPSWMYKTYCPLLMIKLTFKLFKNNIATPSPHIFDF